MIEERYEVKYHSNNQAFEFISEGPKGSIRKFVQYTETRLKNYYNLGFGDKDNDNSIIDDSVVTNNGDSKKILATVALTLFHFTDHHPDANVIAIGSSLARTRLYRMGITKNLEVIKKDFNVFGLKNKAWHSFTKGVEYDAFLVTRKILNLHNDENKEK